MDGRDKTNDGNARLGRSLRGGVTARLARARRARRALPGPLRRLGLRLMPWEATQREFALLRRESSGQQVPDTDSRGRPVLGVVSEFSGSHAHFLAACRDLGVSCRVVDLTGPDWVDVVRGSGCDAFLVRPEYLVRAWKQRQDERIRIMTEEMGLLVHPSPKELWLYESKIRTADWLAANDVPHPRTWVFQSEADALDFARSAPLPIVVKSDFGSAASGVRIVRNATTLEREVKRRFRKGLVLPLSHPMDRQWGAVLLQEFVPDAREWRAIRVGGSFFALEKLRLGDFHSGSGRWRHDDPPLRLMDFMRALTDEAGFTSMSIDVLETETGEYLVSEMHTFFASPNPYKMKVDGRTGRYLYDDASDSWRFEEGTFCENACCNLRVETVLETLRRRASGESRQ